MNKLSAWLNRNMSALLALSALALILLTETIVDYGVILINWGLSCFY